jgi:hypothetical protein
MMLPNFFTLAFLPFLHVVASVSISKVYEHTVNGTWAENLAIRPNGKILVTRSDVPELWQVDPSTKTAEMIQRFAFPSGLWGITRLKNDKYAIITNQFPAKNSSLTTPVNQIVLLEIDGDSILQRTPITIRGSEFLNGITTLNADKEVVLMTDSNLGILYRLKIKTGEYEVLLDDPTMDPANGRTTGINGVKVLKNFIYFTSSTQSLFCRVRTDRRGNVIGDVEVVANITGFYLDDFIIDPHSKTAFIATNVDNEILQVTSKGKVTKVAGNFTSGDLAGATAIQFSNDRKDELFVTTSGGSHSLFNMTSTQPWKVVKLKLEGLKKGNTEEEDSNDDDSDDAPKEEEEPEEADDDDD